MNQSLISLVRAAPKIARVTMKGSLIGGMVVLGGIVALKLYDSISEVEQEEVKRCVYGMVNSDCRFNEGNNCIIVGGPATEQFKGQVSCASYELRG